jgi:hypothetical protein
VILLVPRLLDGCFVRSLQRFARPHRPRSCEVGRRCWRRLFRSARRAAVPRAAVEGVRLPRSPDLLIAADAGGDPLGGAWARSTSRRRLCRLRAPAPAVRPIHERLAGGAKPRRGGKTRSGCPGGPVSPPSRPFPLPVASPPPLSLPAAAMTPITCSLSPSIPTRKSTTPLCARRPRRLPRPSLSRSGGTPARGRSISRSTARAICTRPTPPASVRLRFPPQKGGLSGEHDSDQSHRRAGPERSRV